MALNRDKVGTSYPPLTHEITREEIHLYAQALGETDPRYTSDGDDCVAPPTYAARFTIIDAAAGVFADQELGIHFALVHGSQAYEFGRPMRPGDVVTVTTTIGDISYRGRNEFMRLDIDCRYEDGSLAVKSTNTIVFLGSAPRDDEPAGEVAS